MPVLAMILGAITALVFMRHKHMANPCQGPMTVAEVQAMLAELGAEVPDANNWANSIVDLLKVLRQESDFGSRAVLWVEMGHLDGTYTGAAEQNVQLHTDVMKAVGERKITP